jgi:hypothetical protein
VSDPAEPQLADAQLLHIFGHPLEAHCVVFAQWALGRGVEFIFDLPPRPADPSSGLEEALSTIQRAALDDAERARYMDAYEAGRLMIDQTAGPTREEVAQAEARFAEVVTRAAAVLVPKGDLELVRAGLPPAVAARLSVRGVFALPEPPAAAVGHLVPTAPFALVHDAIGQRSNALCAALAAEAAGIPLVVAGPVYDVIYLQTLRACAPNAIVLADASAATIAALYGRAAIVVDAAPRPRSAANALRAIALGALPVIAGSSPLVRLLGPEAPTFPVNSVRECARALGLALARDDRARSVATLHERLAVQRDPATTFTQVMSAYSRAATAV